MASDLGMVYNNEEDTKYFCINIEKNGIDLYINLSGQGTKVPTRESMRLRPHPATQPSSLQDKLRLPPNRPAKAALITDYWTHDCWALAVVSQLA